MSSKKNIDRDIDRAAGAIRDTRVPEAQAARIAERVRERLERRLAAAGPDAATAEMETIRGCDDYQTLIPAFLSGDLAPSRALLLEDHTRHCVPCRKALKAARSGETLSPSTTNTGKQGGWNAGRWAAAALVAVGAGLGGYLFWNSTPVHSYGAVVESPGAGLVRVSSLAPVGAGEKIAFGERVRAAAGDSPVLRLPDGTGVEVRGRSELAIDSNRRSTTLRMERGEVIVEAAEQGSGRLYVATDDCLVSVKGTIFAVSHGTKGSRVSVIEGEVRMDFGGEERALFAGDRATTYAAYGSAAASGFDEELAWSRNTDRYLALLAEVQELREVLARELPWPSLRYSSRLLALTPDEVAFYAAFPNLAETLVEANRIVDEQVSSSPLLAEWWNSSDGAPEVRQMLDRVTAAFGEAGNHLGDEVVMAMAPGDEGEMDSPIFLAELTDPGALEGFLATELAELQDPDDHIAVYRGELPAVLPEDTLIVWLGDDTMVAGTEAGVVRAAVARVEGGVAIPTNGFKARLAEAYTDGTDILVAMDLQRVGPAAEMSSGETSAEDREVLERTGFLGARHLILQHRRIDGRAHNDAVLAFDGPRQGVASWLAEPAPMGSLGYISPDAKIAAAAVLRNPVEVFDEMLAMAVLDEGCESCSPESELARFQSETGIDPRADLAAALGGEVAMALDGPVVPEPAWKMIVEVYDPGKIVWAVQQIVAYANVKLAEEGEEPVSFVEESADGRIYYGVEPQREDAKPMWFAFDEGYMIAAGNRALVDRAIRFRQSGYTLESSSRFTALLPEDGRANFSAFVYQDALSLLEPLAGKIGELDLTDEQRTALDSLHGEAEPILAYAYGEESRIVFAASGIGDLFASGLPSLLSFGLIDQELEAEAAMEAAEAQPAGDTV